MVLRNWSAAKMKTLVHLRLSWDIFCDFKQNKLIYLFLMFSLTEALSGYHEFLKKEYAEENILFVSEVEEYKKLQSEKSRRTKADEIYSKYILEDSPQEVCI